VALDLVPTARDRLLRAAEPGVPTDGPGDVGRDDVGVDAAPVRVRGLEGDGDRVAVRAEAHVAVSAAAGSAGGAAGRVGTHDGLDLVVAGGRLGVVGLVAHVGVGGVPALRLPVVD